MTSQHPKALSGDPAKMEAADRTAPGSDKSRHGRWIAVFADPG
jgi:hypothetical protein